MKPFIPVVAVLSLGSASLFAQSESVYTNFIRQVQFPALADGSYLEKDVSVGSSGTQLSPLAIDTGGARFELWAVRTAHDSEYLLDSSFVGSYIPTAAVTIETEDPYPTIPRTRADRTFKVKVTVSGLLSGTVLPNGDAMPAAAKSVNLIHHVQSYGVGGTGENINPDNATLLETTPLTENVADKELECVVMVPAGDLTKATGEERFSVFSLDDYQAPASSLASQKVQIWPTCDGALSGIKTGDKIRFEMPQITVTLNDLYPGSKSYLRAYQGEALAAGEKGSINLSSYFPCGDSVPMNKELIIPPASWNEILTQDGAWTIELVTETPFSPDPELVRDKAGVPVQARIQVDRSIRLNSNITTSE
ncbi:MAG TPA: hypothetical protein VIM57_00820 [Luteolibacter sp.]